MASESETAFCVFAYRLARRATNVA